MSKIWVQFEDVNRTIFLEELKEMRQYTEKDNNVFCHINGKTVTEITFNKVRSRVLQIIDNNKHHYIINEA